MTGDHDHRPDTPHPADGDQGAVAPTGWPPPDWPVIVCVPPPSDTTEPEGGVSVFVPDWYSGRVADLAAVAVALDETDGGAVPCRVRYTAIAFGFETARTGNPPRPPDGHGGDHRAHIAGFLLAGAEGVRIMGGAYDAVRITDRLLAAADHLAPLLDADTPQGIADRLRRTADTNNIYGRPAEGDTNTEGGR